MLWSINHQLPCFRIIISKKQIFLAFLASDLRTLNDKPDFKGGRGAQLSSSRKMYAYPNNQKVIHVSMTRALAKCHPNQQSKVWWSTGSSGYNQNADKVVHWFSVLHPPKDWICQCGGLISLISPPVSPFRCNSKSKYERIFHYPQPSFWKEVGTKIWKIFIYPYANLRSSVIQLLFRKFKFLTSILRS